MNDYPNNAPPSGLAKIVNNEITLLFTRVVLPSLLTLAIGAGGYFYTHDQERHERAERAKEQRLTIIENNVTATAASQGRIETKLTDFIEKQSEQRADDVKRIDGNTNRIERMENWFHQKMGGG